MNIIKNRKVRNLGLALVDAGIAVLSSLLALALRFDISALPRYYLSRAVSCMPAYVVVAIVVLYVFSLYSRVWTYASLKELKDIVLATLTIEAFILAWHVYRQVEMPRSYYVLQFVAMAVLFTVVRFSKAILLASKGRRSKEKITHEIMIVGAGEAATILMKELEKPGTHARVVCAIDDNINKKNKTLMGVPIVGTRNDISRMVKRYDVTEIIIAMPSAKSDDIKEIIRICQATGLPVKILPSVMTSLSSSIVGELRPVTYEDLLGRDAVKVDESGIGDFIKGKTVMVTGGGGSIGAELCRQIVRYQPAKLLIFDIYENNAYDIEMELERHYPDISISALIGSVRDFGRLEFIFEKYRPDIVYHAAAHKHVPLMEKSPNEAIKNNCLGTWNVAKLADKYKSENFTLISTDKAVRPTNIMGATKRICEMIVQVYGRKSPHTRYSAVRFGNVLGSNGSVIPLFLKQIEEGGPVTVTHKEIRRFFMTIPEAVSLVLQASLYAKGGEIFVLDMGEPVRIYDLAENLIRMKGFSPNKDIDIEIIGLRPGEKLYEEVLMDEEGLDKTANNLIYVGKPMEIDDDKFLAQLENLIAEAYKNGCQIKELTEEVCGTYVITDND